MKRVGRWFAIGFLALTALAGLANAMNELGRLDTFLQNTVAFADALWGVLGLFAAVGMWRRRPWTLTVTVAWAIAVTYTGTVASFAFHDPSLSQSGTLPGAIAACAALMAVTGLIVWAARVATRAPAAEQSTPV